MSVIRIRGGEQLLVDERGGRYGHRRILPTDLANGGTALLHSGGLGVATSRQSGSTEGRG